MSNSAKPLDGKVAIVTGAGSPTGLGRAMTLALVRAGARVAMLDVDEGWLERTDDEVRAVGGDDCALPLVCDVSDPDSAEEAVRGTIAGLGGLHVLVNNAGMMNPSARGSGGTSFWDIAPETWSRIVAVNSSGPFYMARAAVGHMLAQGWGRIIGVTTSVDSMYRAGLCPYGPSKAIHEALVALMAQELEGTRGHGQCPRTGRDDRHQPHSPGRRVRPGIAHPAGGDAGAGRLARVRGLGRDKWNALPRAPLG